MREKIRDKYEIFTEIHSRYGRYMRDIHAECTFESTYGCTCTGGYVGFTTAAAARCCCCCSLLLLLAARCCCCSLLLLTAAAARCLLLLAAAARCCCSVLPLAAVVRCCWPAAVTAAAAASAVIARCVRHCLRARVGWDNREIEWLQVAQFRLDES